MKLRRKIDSETINAIHDDKFENFLSSIGKLEDIKEGKCKCKFCGETITLDNIYTVFSDSGQIKFTCDKVACIVKFCIHNSEK